MKNIIATSNGSTLKWKDELVNFVMTNSHNIPELESFYKTLGVNLNDVGIHLAIFAEPFLSLLLSGKKTVESRFSLNQISPFNKVKRYDIVFVKKSGGNILAYFVVGCTEFIHDPTSLQLTKLKKRYSEAIGSASMKNFWKERECAKYISFLQVIHVSKLTPIKIKKRDRLAWCVLRLATNNIN